MMKILSKIMAIFLSFAILAGCGAEIPEKAPDEIPESKPSEEIISSEEKLFPTEEAEKLLSKKY